MSKFWKAIGLGGGKELEYDIGDPIGISDDYKYRINWQMNKAYHKTDRTEATVFSFEIKPNSAPEAIELCRNCVRRARTLMLPNVLKYIDGMETPACIYMVTEPVRPLHVVLPELLEEGEVKFREFVSWGLYSVIQGLEHLHMGGKVHGNFGIHSIYVNKCGDWKIFGLDWCSPLEAPLVAMTDGKMEVNHFKQYNILIPNELKAPELLKGNMTLIESSPIYAIDAWALGLLFFEIFNHQITSSTTPADLKNPGSMPRPIFGAFMGLISHTAKLRLNPAKLLQDGGIDYFADSEYIRVQLQLENMALIVRDHLEMENFFRKLEHMVEAFPRMNCKYKILPKLAEATKFGSGGTAALTTILKLAEQLLPEEYQTLVVPGLLALYESRDPNVRIRLLQTIPMYIQHVREPEISTLWQHLATGFASPFAEIRELSVKALVPLVPHLSERLISSEVMKQLWQMQTDKEGGIRTNAIICLGKIAPLLSHPVREKMLIPSFTRSLKDPFHHSRIACCNSFSATAEFYSDMILAGQVVGSVAPLCADPNKEVRQAAIKCLQILIHRLQKMSDGVLDSGGVTETRQAPRTTKDAGYLGWAMSSLKTTLYGEEEHKAGQPPRPSQGAPPPPLPPQPSAASGASGDTAEYAQPHGEQEAAYYDADQAYDPNADYGDYQYDENAYYGEEYPAEDAAQEPPPENNAWGHDLSDIEDNTSKKPAGDGWGNDWDEDEEKEPEPPKPPPPKVVAPKSTPTSSGSASELKKKPARKTLGAVRRPDKLAAD